MTDHSTAVADDLRVMSEADPEKCGRYAATIRAGLDRVAPSMHTFSADLKGSRFSTIGFAMEHVALEDGSTTVSVEIGRDDGDGRWDRAMVRLDPAGFDEPRHPLAPKHSFDNWSKKVIESDLLMLRAAAERSCALLDIAADPARDMPIATARMLRARVVGISAMLVQENEGRERIDVIWASHDGPLRAVAYGSDAFGTTRREILDDGRRAAWSSGLPPVLGVADRGHVLALRPMLLGSATMTDDVVARMRMAAVLADL